MTSPEFTIHLAVLGYLRAALPRDACGPIHIPNGENRDAKTGARLKRMGTLAGAPDLVWWWGGKSYVIEIKAAGSLSATQRAFREAFETAGGHYGVARSVEDAAALLKVWGVPTRARIKTEAG